jgi:hypothetical protein
MNRAAVLLFATSLSSSACATMVRSVDRTQPIEVAVEPSDAQVWQQDTEGRRMLVGVGPQTVQARYAEQVRDFSPWWWGVPLAATALAVGDAAGLMVLNQAYAEAPAKIAAGTMIGIGAVAAAVTLPLCILGALHDGEPAETPPQPIQLGASRAGYADAVQALTLPGPEREVRLVLSTLPAATDVVSEAPVPDPPASAAAPAPRKPIVAVFDLEDASGNLSIQVRDQLTEYLAVNLAANGYEVVPREQLRAQLVAEKAKSYEECRDSACQIELGKAVAAQKTIVPKLIRAGKKCAMTISVFDLRNESREGGATRESLCEADAVFDALAALTRELKR